MLPDVDKLGPPNFYFFLSFTSLTDVVEYQLKVSDWESESCLPSFMSLSFALVPCPFGGGERRGGGDRERRCPEISLPPSSLQTRGVEKGEKEGRGERLICSLRWSRNLKFVLRVYQTYIRQIKPTYTHIYIYT